MIDDTLFPQYPSTRIKAEIRAAQGHSIPREAVDEIVDIACHAAVQARRTLLQVLSYPNDLRVTKTATGIALSLLNQDLTVMLEAVKAAAGNDLSLIQVRS